jgi:glycosyltransferase involved in cell wall biosynthesis
LPHSGEGSWKKILLRKLFYPRATGFFFYSKFARSQFEVHFSTYTAKKHELIFQPFSYIKNLTDKVSPQGKYILFFGRLSHYKGIDLLLEAIPKVISLFPNEHFVIAGNDEGYVLDKTILEQYKGHITIDDTYQTTSQLATKIVNSKFIICPYRDATQSGVLMTANALGKIALATNVGAFPEYIENEVNGLLVEPDVDAIASAMILVLKNEWYKEMEMNLTVAPSNMVAQLNETAFLTAFKY